MRIFLFLLIVFSFVACQEKPDFSAKATVDGTEELCQGDNCFYYLICTATVANDDVVVFQIPSGYEIYDVSGILDQNGLIAPLRPLGISGFSSLYYIYGNELRITAHAAGEVRAVITLK
jgi:hypothetical protein